MGLDQRGDIAIAEIVFYIPIFVAALLLTIRHGIGRQAGWIFLLTFSIGTTTHRDLLITCEN